MKLKVGIVIGSDSDLKIMQQAGEMLERFGVEHEITIASAHRSPRRASDYARQARRRGIGVIIAGAGGAAHLAGVLASETTLPVIGVPIDSSPLQGLDSLLSTVQMPAGVPVAAMGIGASGARNAAILAVQILSLSDPELARKLTNFKRHLADEVRKKGERLKGR